MNVELFLFFYHDSNVEVIKSRTADLPECLTIWLLPDYPTLSSLDSGDCLAAAW